jgi:lipoprotein-anchoring transpeptidase ErfK/SrfK
MLPIIKDRESGHETPTGDFTVSEKDLSHHSNLYENAPMPYFMRLTDGGIGMRAGFLPGYPASHGRVRLPSEMARELYQRVESGTSVQITDDSINASVAQNPTPTGPVVQN